MFGLFKKNSKKLSSQLDESINFYVKQISDNPSIPDAELVDLANKNNINPKNVWEVAGLFPLIVGRLIFHDLGINFSDRYRCIDDNGKVTESGKLVDHPVFIAIHTKLKTIKNEEFIKTVALRGAEVNAINDALSSGSDPKDLTTAPITLLNY